MNLKEPRRKRRIYQQQYPPLPVCIGKKDQWIIYTAHLGVANACISDPQEMKAVHNMVIIFLLIIIKNKLIIINK